MGLDEVPFEEPGSCTKKTTFLIPYSSENILDQKSNNLPNPIASMYGIFTHIYY